MTSERGWLWVCGVLLTFALGCIVVKVYDTIDCWGRGGKLQNIGTYYNKGLRQYNTGCTVPTKLFPVVRPAI